MGFIFLALKHYLLWFYFYEVSLTLLALNFFLVILFFILGWLKIFLSRNHLINYLIIIEFNIILMYYRLIVKISVLRSSTTRVFFFIVIIVCGACVGISLLVILTRIINKELELVNTSLIFN